MYLHRLKQATRHDGIRTLAMILISTYLMMYTVPDRIFKLTERQKLEYLRTLKRRVRRKAQSLFSLDNDCIH